MVGHSNLGFADALRRAEERGELTLHRHPPRGRRGVRRLAYGKLTGRPAACFAIAGPGSTNLLTGLYDAKLDRAPVLAISGQVPSKVLGPRRVPGPRPVRGVPRRRRLDRRPCTPARDHAELAATRRQARARRPRRRAPRAARRGAGRCPSDAPAGSAARPAAPTWPVAAADDAGRRRCDLLAGRPPTGDHRRARRARRRRPRCVELAERLDAPVLTTFKAKGLVPDTHPLGAGVLGRSGTPVASAG